MGAGFARSVDVLRRDLERRARVGGAAGRRPVARDDAGSGRDQRRAQQDALDQAGDDGQHRRGAGHQPVPHAGRRRSGPGGLDRAVEGERLAHRAGRDRRGGRRRRHRPRGEDGDERARGGSPSGMYDARRWRPRYSREDAGAPCCASPTCGRRSVPRRDDAAWTWADQRPSGPRSCCSNLRWRLVWWL